MHADAKPTTACGALIYAFDGALIFFHALRLIHLPRRWKDDSRKCHNTKADESTTKARRDVRHTPRENGVTRRSESDTSQGTKEAPRDGSIAVNLVDLVNLVNLGNLFT